MMLRKGLISRNVLLHPNLNISTFNVLQSTAQVVEESRNNNTSILKRGKPKNPRREPLVKNFLIGVIDKELLSFPEVIPRDDHAKLMEDKSYFQESYDTTLSLKSLDEMKNLGLFGLNVPQMYGGKGLFMSESLWADENMSAPFGMLFSSHRTIVDVIAQCGSNSQKEKYLYKLAKGSLIGKSYIHELEPTKDNIFNTKAVYDPAENTWTMNGEKAFVANANGPSADLFLVIAQSNPVSLEHEHKLTCSSFLIEASTPGVSVGKVQKNLGDWAVETCTLNLKNVKLNESHIVGGKLRNHKVGEVYSKSSRLRSALIGLELSKKFINHMTNFCIDTKQCGLYLKDMDNIKDKISSLVGPLYAMESMIYYTAGLVDEFYEQDVAIESAITKYYTYQILLKIARTALEFMGPKVLMKGEKTEELFRASTELYTQSEPMESLKSFISFGGLEHAGMSLRNDVLLSRNPLYHPMHIIKKFVKSSDIHKISANMGIHEHVHPSLAVPSECIELSVIRLKMCVEMLFNRYGNEIVHKNVEIGRLAEIMSICFAMYTSVARASRSYCIGLRHSDNELLVAHAISLDGKERVKTLAQEIMDGPYLTNDNNLQKMSKQIFKSKGYFMEHPLTYNF